MWGCTIESKIDNSSAGSALHLLYPPEAHHERDRLMNSGRGCRAVNPSVCSAYDETSKRARVDEKAGGEEDDEIRNEKVETSRNPGVRCTRRDE
ncbi:hypothetical protein G5I_02806 [Acromyrmex echinatior]|uniref:Uncharacterized protein n=1 Tax=Acromyrmex echinatior TaxID=103372 RepID=F4WBA0_ACREC|nr:hypothetical protein G5I_02806 [Acromyrmex echinatior]